MMQQQKEIKAILDRHQPKIDKQYAENLQLARYTNLSEIESSKYIQDVGLDKEKRNAVIFIEGNVQHRFSDQHLIYYFIKTLDLKVDQNPYIIVYFIGETDGSNEFERFRKLLKSLPLKYYLKLNCMYVHHASLFVRTKLWFQGSQRGKFWLKRTTFVGEIEYVFKQPNILPEWVDFLPNRLLNPQMIQEKEKRRLQGLINNQRIFGKALEYQKLNQQGIPLILENLMLYFTSNPEHFQKQDIFRKCGSVDYEQQLMEMLDQEMFDCLNIVEDVNLVCSMIKKFFAQLPEPIIPEPILMLICNSIQSVNTRQKEQDFIEAILTSLPHLNKIVLQVIASFLVFVATYWEQNRMTQQNLAIVFAPCFFRILQKNLKAVEMVGIQISFLRLLFNNFETMFPEFSFRLFLNEKQNLLTSTSSSNSSTGPETSNKNNSESEESDSQNLETNPRGHAQKQVDI